MKHKKIWQIIIYSIFWVIWFTCSHFFANNYFFILINNIFSACGIMYFCGIFMDYIEYRVQIYKFKFEAPIIAKTINMCAVKEVEKGLYKLHIKGKDCDDE